MKVNCVFLRGSAVCTLRGSAVCTISTSPLSIHFTKDTIKISIREIPLIVLGHSSNLSCKVVTLASGNGATCRYVHTYIDIVILDKQVIRDWHVLKVLAFCVNSASLLCVVL